MQTAYGNIRECNANSGILQLYISRNALRLNPFMLQTCFADRPVHLLHISYMIVLGVNLPISVYPITYEKTIPLYCRGYIIDLMYLRVYLNEESDQVHLKIFQHLWPSHHI